MSKLKIRRVGRPRKRKYQEDDEEYDFETELKKCKVEAAVNMDSKTRLKHLKELLNRSNFYANSLLTVIAEQQKKHKVRTQRKLNKRRKQLKKIESQILKDYGKDCSELPMVYRTWLESEEDQISFGEKICFRVARTCSHLVKKVHRLIKSGVDGPVSTANKADIKEMADMFTNDPKFIFETIGIVSSTIGVDESIMSYEIIETASSQSNIVNENDAALFQKNIIEVNDVDHINENFVNFISYMSESSDSEVDSDDGTSLSSKPSHSSKSSINRQTKNEKLTLKAVKVLLYNLVDTVCSKSIHSPCENNSCESKNITTKIKKNSDVDETPDSKRKLYVRNDDIIKCRRHIDLEVGEASSPESNFEIPGEKLTSDDATCLIEELNSNKENWAVGKSSCQEVKRRDVHSSQNIISNNLNASPKEAFLINTQSSVAGSDSQTSNYASKVPCPICCKLVNENKINEHLDICISGGERRESLRASTYKRKPTQKKKQKKTGMVQSKNGDKPHDEKKTQELRSVEKQEECVAENCIQSPDRKKTKQECSLKADNSFVSPSRLTRSSSLKITETESSSQFERTNVAKEKETKSENKVRNVQDELEKGSDVETSRKGTEIENVLSQKDPPISENSDEKSEVLDLDAVLGYVEEPDAAESLSSDEEELELVPPVEVRRSTRASRCRKSFRECSDEEGDEENSSEEETFEEVLSEKEAVSEQKSAMREKKKKKQAKDSFHVGDVVEISWGRGESMVLYKAKILDRCPTDDDNWTYLVHYVGWTEDYDDWILSSDIHSVIEAHDDDYMKSRYNILSSSDDIITEEDKRLLDEKFYMPGFGKSAPRSMLKEKNGVRYYNDTEVSAAQPKLFTGGVLRDYQIVGYEWLKTLYENSENGILADEMGLGKTIQCIAIVARMIENGITGPFLICAPMSTIQNWFLEFKRFAPKIPLLLYHGTAAERGTLSLCMVQREKKLRTKPVVITTYDVLMRDRMILQVHLWSYMIIDEGHRIKNLKCKLLKELKYIECQAKLLLTGTPLQNNLSELWSLLNFLLPEVFDDLKTFETWFDVDRLKRDKNLLSMIHKILTPFLLRRMKCDVDLKIPPKKELVIYAPLTPKQERFYRALVNKSIFELMQQKEYYQTTIGVANPDLIAQKQNSQELVVEELSKRRSTRSKLENVNKPAAAQRESYISNMSMSNIIMQLRKCCNHPYLIEYPMESGTEDLRIDEDIISTSGKLRVLDQLLPELKKRGHKVLLFSQMTKMLDILEDYCSLRGYCNVRIDGQMARDERVRSMNEFTIDPEVFLFLLSTRAGGLGINLTAADTVIIYDSDWNPQNDAQAQDRCHRIGQERPVVVYRLITASTVDQQIVERASKKLALEKVIMHKTLFKGNLEQELSEKDKIHPEELLHLLQTSKDSSKNDDNSSGVLSKEKLADLLDRSEMWKSMERPTTAQVLP